MLLGPLCHSAVVSHFPQISFCCPDTYSNTSCCTSHSSLASTPAEFWFSQHQLASSENVSVFLFGSPLHFRLLCTSVLYLSSARRSLFIHGGLLPHPLHIRLAHLSSKEVILEDHLVLLGLSALQDSLPQYPAKQIVEQAKICFLEA